MNNKDFIKKEKKEVYSIGKYLKEEREKAGLTQQDIANDLCLKLSTIIDIENDESTEKICLTFLNGYIRSYARLIKLPESKIKELVCNKEKNYNLKFPIQSYSSNKIYKKNNWLVISTWSIIFLIIILIIAWYYHYYKDLQNEFINTNNKENNINLNLNRDQSNFFR